jgi:hypothetical protein
VIKFVECDKIFMIIAQQNIPVSWFINCKYCYFYHPLSFVNSTMSVKTKMTWI